eukprot:9407699-Alexandrium_andersonii.AAC.1
MSSNPPRHQQRKLWRWGPHGLAKAGDALFESRACAPAIRNSRIATACFVEALGAVSTQHAMRLKRCRQVRRNNVSAALRAWYLIEHIVKFVVHDSCKRMCTVAV